MVINNSVIIRRETHKTFLTLSSTTKILLISYYAHLRFFIVYRNKKMNAIHLRINLPIFY